MRILTLTTPEGDPAYVNTGAIVAFFPDAKATKVCLTCGVVYIKETPEYLLNLLDFNSES